MFTLTDGIIYNSPIKTMRNVIFTLDKKGLGDLLRLKMEGKARSDDQEALKSTRKAL